MFIREILLSSGSKCEPRLTSRLSLMDVPHHLHWNLLHIELRLCIFDLLADELGFAAFEIFPSLRCFRSFINAFKATLDLNVTAEFSFIHGRGVIDERTYQFSSNLEQILLSVGVYSLANESRRFPRCRILMHSASLLK